jgi:hypothetical protein
MSMSVSYRSSTLWTLLILIAITLCVFPVTATIFADDGTNRTSSDLYNLTNSTQNFGTNSSVVFFFDPDCGACGPAHEYMDAYLANHTDAHVEVVNLSSGQESKDRLEMSYESFHREWENIPVAFIGPVGLEGTQEIITNFDGVYTWYSKNNTQ